MSSRKANSNNNAAPPAKAQKGAHPSDSEADEDVQSSLSTSRVSPSNAGFAIAVTGSPPVFSSSLSAASSASSLSSSPMALKLAKLKASVSPVKPKAKTANPLAAGNSSSNIFNKVKLTKASLTIVHEENDESIPVAEIANNFYGVAKFVNGEMPIDGENIVKPMTIIFPSNRLKKLEKFGLCSMPPELDSQYPMYFSFALSTEDEERAREAKGLAEAHEQIMRLVDGHDDCSNSSFFQVTVKKIPATDAIMLALIALNA